MSQLSDDCFAFGGKLMSVDTALSLIRERVTPIVETESIALRDALGRILAEDIVSPLSVPPHDNSAVDGYALRSRDLKKDDDTRLALVGRAAAGHPWKGTCEAGQAVRIFTGAVIPSGCDSVIMQEDVRVEGETVILPPGLKQGANRRRAGEDIEAGRTILSRGTRLRAQDIGLAATVGRGQVTVFRRLKVALFSTGDEVREPGRPLADGAIYDSNRYSLGALLKGLGLDVTDLGILPDKADLVRASLENAAAGHDLLITSAGVSTGEEDHVRGAVEALGRIDFWRIAVKPGRPIALGHVRGRAFVGLPGNPVAAMACFMRFARPIILRLGGARESAPVTYPVRAAFAMKKKSDRREWLRARLERTADGMLEARLFPAQGSGILTSMVESDGLVELREDLTEVTRGQMVDFLPFNEVS